MSEENVEVVRGFYESLDRWLASYWSEPQMPIEESAELDAMFDHLAPEAEWDWLVSPETFRGRNELVQALADYLDTVGDWRVEMQELIRRNRGPSPGGGPRCGSREGQRRTCPSADLLGVRCPGRQGRPDRGPHRESRGRRSRRVVGVVLWTKAAPLLCIESSTSAARRRAACQTILRVVKTHASF